jgi:hypothetical protein
MEAQNPYDEVKTELAHLLIGLATFTDEKFNSKDNKHSKDFETGFKQAMMIVIMGLTETYLTELENRSQTWEKVSRSRTEGN